jgi:hypothetical protein
MVLPMRMSVVESFGMKLIMLTMAHASIGRAILQEVRLSVKNIPMEP